MPVANTDKMNNYISAFSIDEDIEQNIIVVHFLCIAFESQLPLLSRPRVCMGIMLSGLRSGWAISLTQEIVRE